MRFANLLFPSNRLTRPLSAISVRTRIIVLALVPVVGFLATGLTYVSGERDVGTAFETVKRSAALADASRDFKSAIAAIRIIVKDFNADPSDNLVISFEQEHGLALQSLDAIVASVDHRHAESIAALRKDVMALRDTFTELVGEQKILGFDEAAGLRIIVSRLGAELVWLKWPGIVALAEYARLRDPTAAEVAFVVADGGWKYLSEDLWTRELDELEENLEAKILW